MPRRDPASNPKGPVRRKRFGRFAGAGVGMIVAGAVIAPALADNAAYRGRLRCGAIPSLTLAPVDVEFAMTVRGGTASYQRPVLSWDGRQVVAQENGVGRFAADGTVDLQGGASGRLGSFTGRAAGSHLELSGTQAFTAPQQYNRPCTVSLDRSG